MYGERAVVLRETELNPQRGGGCSSRHRRTCSEFDVWDIDRLSALKERDAGGEGSSSPDQLLERSLSLMHSIASVPIMDDGDAAASRTPPKSPSTGSAAPEPSHTGPRLCRGSYCIRADGKQLCCRF